MRSSRKREGGRLRCTRDGGKDRRQEGRKKEEELQQIKVPTSDGNRYGSTLNKLGGQTVIWLPFTGRCAVQMAG